MIDPEFSVIVVGGEKLYEKVKPSLEELVGKHRVRRHEVPAPEAVCGSERTAVLFLPYWKKAYPEGEWRDIMAAFTALMRDTGVDAREYTE